jgi:hypothetical protein
MDAKIEEMKTQETNIINNKLIMKIKNIISNIISVFSPEYNLDNFNTNIAAATIIFFGFSTSLLVTMPLLLCASYFTIVLGTALYLSADAYSEYKEKQLVEENLKFIGKNTQTAKANTQAAWHKFATTITKNTVMPIIIMATLAVCWQAALALIILSIAYEYATKYYQTHQNHGGGAIENAQFAP